MHLTVPYAAFCKLLTFKVRDLYSFKGPSEDEEDESELTVTEIKEQRIKQKKEAELLHQARQEEMEREGEERKKKMQDRGCSWGIGKLY